MMSRLSPAEVQQQRQEAYERWAGEQLADARLTMLRHLIDDIRGHGQVLDDTWERFDIEDRTYAAEILDAPHSHIDRFDFDGRDIIVKEADGINPRQTLRSVYWDGLQKSRQDAIDEPGLAFQVRRDELFMQFYDQIEKMMRGELTTDTIHMISTCPLPSEIAPDDNEANRLLALKYYDTDRRKSFDYTARRLPNGQLELSATTLDSSDMQAHAEVLRASGHDSVAFALMPSHEYGNYLSYDNTTQVPIELVIAARVGVYDDSLEAQTGRKHRHGREGDTIDAHEFFDAHCDDYWAGYKAYHELLARHLAGQEMHDNLRQYLWKRCYDLRNIPHQQVIEQDKLDKLYAQLRGTHITPDMTMTCRELLVYAHHATLRRLLEEFEKTGKVTPLLQAGGSLLDSYADTAGANGAASAVKGEVFAGCETATGNANNSLTAAAAASAATGGSLTLEQALRAQQKEAMHCLEIKLLGFTYRRGVTCPFCTKKVDAKDTAATIECLGADCRTVLVKATGKTFSRLQTDDESGELAEIIPLRLSNQNYTVGGQLYRRRQRAVVGGAKIVYLSGDQEIEGVQAELLEAVIVSQETAAASRAA